MKSSAMLRVTLLATSLGVFTTAVCLPSLAQNALGGPAKTKQNAIGGASKPAPVVGGTAAPASTIPKPATIGGVTKPTSAGGAVTGGSIGSGTAGLSSVAAKQNPPVVPPNKSTGVVTTSSNLKCGGGACVTRGAKP